MAKVEVRGVRKAFGGGKTILDGVSFSAEDGEFVALLGPSGCGKTTLLRIVAGLESPDSGSVAIGGSDATALAPKDRDIAMVFQSYALYPHLTVEENIAMGLKLRGVAAGETARRVLEAAGKLGLADFLARRPATLSGGQRQRVALARALVRLPKAFLLDEPLSNLDAALRDRTRGELKLLFKSVRGTVLYVTHDQIEAMTLSDKIVLLDRGRVQQVGAPEEIYRRPANVFVAGFLGSPPMNILPLADIRAAGLAAAGPDGALGGFRPEDLEVSAAEKPGWAATRVVLAEPLGEKTVLTLELAGKEARASAAADWPKAAARAWLRLDPRKLHLFDAVTSSRID